MGATGHGEYKYHDQEGRDPPAERLDASARSHSDHVPIIPRIPWTIVRIVVSGGGVTSVAGSSSLDSSPIVPGLSGVEGMWTVSTPSDEVSEIPRTVPDLSEGD